MPADRALVLRRFPYSESSLVAWVLTRDHGRVHVLARGAYRMQSRFFGVLDLFDELELEWSQNPRRELAELRKGDVARRRKPLREDLGRYRAGVAMLELADVGSRPGRTDRPLYELLTACLDRLTEPDRDADATLVVFQLGFLQNHGLAPALARCAACDREAPPTDEDAARAWFSAGSGGRLCAGCADEARAAGRRVGTMPIAVLEDGDTLSRALRAGALPDPERVVPAERLLGLRDLSERFLDYHLDSTLKASRAFLAAPNRNAPHGDSMTRTPILLSLALAALAGGCKSVPLVSRGGVPVSVDQDEIPRAIQEAELALAEDRAMDALNWMRATEDVKGMSTTERERVQSLTEKAADRLISEQAHEKGDTELLVELLDMNLPRQIAVTAGMRAAELQVDRGELKDAYETIREVDKLYPTHHERSTAAALLAELGIRLSYDTGGFLFFTDNSDDGMAALEYFVMNYPARPRGDEAYRRLADMYEAEEKWELAIERHEELILEHPDSPLVPESKALIPHLRLRAVTSPEYDRGAVFRARGELEEWLRDHAGHPFEDFVRADLADARRRLAESDLGIARFYAKIDNSWGARHHAARALEEARAAGDQERIDEATAILEAHGGSVAAR